MSEEPKLWLTGWYGGKLIHLPYILPYIPSHDYYTDVFGGMAPILLNKPISLYEVYNDVNSQLVNLWIAIQNSYDYLMNRCDFSITSRQLWDEYAIPTGDPKEDAYRFLYRITCSYSAIGTQFRGIGDAHTMKTFRGLRERIGKIHYRIEKVLFENQDFHQLLPRVDKDRAFWYIDPPYFKGGEHYENIDGGVKWNENSMEDLYRFMEKAKGLWMLSIDKNVADQIGCQTWIKTYSINTNVNGGIRTPRTEYLIMNYDPEKTPKAVSCHQRNLLDF